MTVLEHLVFAGQTVNDVKVFLLGEKVELGHGLLGIELCGGSGIDHDITLVVDHGVELLGGESEKVTNLVGERAEVPDMSYGHNELDVTHTLAAHLFLGDLDLTAVARDALVADALVFAAMALVVLDGTEDALAEKAVALGLVGAVVDGLGFQHFAARLLENLLGRCKSDGDFGESGFLFVVFSKSHIYVMEICSYKKVVVRRVEERC